MRRSAMGLAAIATVGGLSGCHEHPVRIPPPPVGLCAGMTPVSVESVSGRRISGNAVVVWVPRTMNVDVELVGGGGGGGGTHEGAGPWAAGGQHGQQVLVPVKPMESDTYLVEPGSGGSGGRSDRMPGDGATGTASRIRRCSSGMPIAGADGGQGGKSDSVARRQADGREYAGDGESLRDSITGAIIGKGGAGGYWQTGGAAATDFGAGGGGQGGTTHPGQSRGGRGSDGYAKITVIGR